MVQRGRGPWQGEGRGGGRAAGGRGGPARGGAQAQGRYGSQRRAAARQDLYDDEDEEDEYDEDEDEDEDDELIRGMSPEEIERMVFASAKASAGRETSPASGTGAGTEGAATGRQEANGTQGGLLVATTPASVMMAVVCPHGEA